jgi:hypothetical protein
MFPRDVVMSVEMPAICDAKVASLLAKKAITAVEDDSVGFIFSFFCFPKNMGKYRPIVNLKPVNHFIRYEHFKIEILETARFLVREGDWFVKLYLKDVYLTVPVIIITKSTGVLLGGGVFYQFRCMAFGLSPASRIFAKLLRDVTAILRQQGL